MELILTLIPVSTGYDRSDPRAIEWEDFLVSENLTLENVPGVKTFENSRRHSSTIDLTITGGSLMDVLMNWRVEADSPLPSDHLPIYFELTYNTLNRKEETLHNYRKTDWSFFNDHLHNLLIDLNGVEKLNSPQEIEKYAEELSSSIRSTVKHVVPLSKKVIYKNKWWNSELDRLKHLVRRARRRKDPAYFQLKKTYEEKIYEAKQESWRKFLEITKDREDSFIRYKALTRKPTENKPLGPILNGTSVTRNIKESSEVMLNSLFPDPPPNLAIHDKIKEAASLALACHTTAEPPITEFEVKDAIAKTNPKKTPGVDQIPGVIFHNCREVLLPHLVKTL